MDGDDPSVDTEAATPEQRWREYTDSYELRHSTEWVPAVKDTAPAVFLRRSAALLVISCLDLILSRSILEEDAGSSAIKSMTIRIGLPSYKILYDAGQEDLIVRRRSQQGWAHLEDRAKHKHEERKKFLQKFIVS